jgi:signal transduction histidine kinase
MALEHNIGFSRASTALETELMVENARLRTALIHAGLDVDAALAEADGSAQDETTCVRDALAGTASELTWRQRVEELLQTVRARDDFIAIAAHELRNPMTPIIGFAEAALHAVQKDEGATSPRVTTLLENLRRAAQDFIRRATRLLHVGRIESGTLQLEFLETDLSEVVRNAAQRYAVVAAHADSILDLEIEDGIRGIWDLLAVEEIAENLLSNAIKFGMGQPVTLRLWLDDGLAVLQVQDRGVGMPPDQQVRIFGRFEQVVGQQRGGGFGVGLWVTSGLVAAMQGQIVVTSQPDMGSIFTVTLPLAQKEPSRMKHATR